ncbi:TPA: hypothetical protein HA234_01420 [Candidatus Woesearchaeota archaeon]|nr:hypothetical protein [Candidatus Woesearchaeota archaeon]
MEKFFYKLISVELLLFAILWAIFTIFVSWGTVCFDMFYAYVTIIAFMVQLTWDHFVKPEVTK